MRIYVTVWSRCVLRGLWVRSYFWWLRSPHASTSNHFYNVNENGNLNNNNANNTYAIVPRFFEDEVARAKPPSDAVPESW